MDGGSGVSEKTIGTIITMIKLDKLSPFEEEDKVSDRDNAMSSTITASKCILHQDLFVIYQ